MKKLTLEQQNVVCHASTHNVTVNSVAGCGKTTVSLAIADQYPNRKILLLTYNRTLADETKARANQSNINIYTYHGLCYYTYGLTVNDRDMTAVIVDRVKPIVHPTPYDIIILDETQDMTELYFRFIVKYTADMKPHQPTFVVLGDASQSIYGYKGSDSRYLTLAPDCFRGSVPWVQLTIRESFRVTRQMACFINTHLFRHNYITSKKVKSAQSVFYHVVNPFHFGRYVLDHIRKSNYEPGDVFILTNSTKTRTQSPIKIVENYLADNNYKCYVQGDDEEHVDPKALVNRVHVSSYHRAKGRERKIVFVYGFDRSTYNLHCGLPLASTTAPNTSSRLHQQSVNVFYVALSRATEELHVIQDITKPIYPTVNPKYLTSKFTIDKPAEIKPSTGSMPPSVTTTIRHLPDQAIDRLSSYFTVVSTALERRTTTDSKLAPDLIGSAITLYGDFNLYKTIPCYIRRLISAPPNVNYNRELLKLLVNEYTTKQNSGTLFELASYVDFCEYGYKSNYTGLRGHFHKIDIGPVVQSYDIITGLLPFGSQPQFEVQLSVDCHVDNHTQICGRADIITNDTIYEIKHKTTTSESDIIQLALYGCATAHRDKNLVLVNTKEGRQYTITNFTKRTEFTAVLSELKRAIIHDTSNQEFVTSINRIYTGESNLTYKPSCVNGAKTKKIQSNIDLLGRIQAKKASKLLSATSPHVTTLPAISQSLRAGTASNTSSTPLPTTRNLQNG